MGSISTPKYGSSPLARGLPTTSDQWDEFLRIIPARAGFTTVMSYALSWTADHPRSRGVYYERRGHQFVRGGSSPLARGLPSDLRVGHGLHRIIPARAGFTVCIRRRGVAMPDHPRSRGVYSNGRRGKYFSKGSSPLARGLHQWDEFLLMTSRIIPARAGFTRWTVRSRVISQDHPRSRGVYSHMRGPASTGRGSSPLARGLHNEDALVINPRRIIPARAGFTIHHAR